MRKRPPLTWEDRAILAIVYIIVILLMVFIFHGCAPTRETCERNYGPCGYAETREIIRDTTVYLPGATLTVRTRDTLRTEKRYVITDSTGSLTATYWRDAYGKLWVQCQRRRDTVRVQGAVREVVRWRERPPAAQPDGLAGTVVNSIIGAVVLLVTGAGMYIIIRFWRP